MSHQVSSPPSSGGRDNQNVPPLTSSSSIPLRSLRSIRLTKDIVDYIIEHSGAKLILLDHEFAHLVKGTSLPVILSQDTGKADDPYEQFLGEFLFNSSQCSVREAWLICVNFERSLASGRKFSQERGWAGLEMELDENADASLCYT